MILRCATGNPGKLREFRLASADVDVQPLENLEAIPPPEENGATFEDNAAIKAVYYSGFADEPVFADDSGLEVDALGNAPGVYSARYAGEGAGDLANNRLLVERLQGMEDRTARFVCVIALARQGHLLGVFRAHVQGVVIDQPRGEIGFGYDPHFFYPPFGCTFGEVDKERKFTVSHRGRALRAMLEFVRAQMR